MQTIMLKILNWVFNKNLLLKYVDGYKTQIAGVLIGIALALESVSEFLPIEVQLPVKAISEALKQIAGVFGVVGGLGKIVKLGDKK